MKETTFIMGATMHTKFQADIKKGQLGERRFERLCDRAGVWCCDVSSDPIFRKDKIDFLIYKNGAMASVDVKENYKDNGQIIIEESSNHPRKDGWIYTSKADLIAYTSSKELIFLHTKQFREWWLIHTDQWMVIENRPSTNNGRMWQSAFKIVAIADIPPEFISRMTIK